MAISIPTLLLSKRYTDDSLAGAGAVAGVPCQISSIEQIDGGHRIHFLWEDNEGTEHTDYTDVMDGTQGQPGPRGEVGARGATGEPGRTATVSVGTVTSGDSPAVTNVGTSNDAIFNFVLARGEKGEQGVPGQDGQDGKSFNIKAQYPTYEALIAAHPTGEAGDAYFVGTDDNPDLYVWLTDDQEWFNNGKIAGVKGDKGDTGDDGFSPIASVVKVGNTATISIRDKTGQTTASVMDGADGKDAQYEELPSASATNEGRICQYVGETSGTHINGHFYKCVESEGSFYWVELFGTAMDKDYTDTVRPDSHDLVESVAVYSAINNALSSVYTARGDITVAELTSSLLIETNVGNVYELSDSGTTTALFIQGAGVPLSIGDNVGIIKAGADTYLFNKMAGAFDLTDYQKQELATPLSIGGVSETTVEGALDGLNDVKAEKVDGATNGNLAKLDANGNLQDSGYASTVLGTIFPRSEQRVLGAKNFVPYPYPVSSATVNGITFTTYSDGRVVANGTATELAIFDVINSELYKPFALDEGNYILTDGLSSSDYENAYTAITLTFSDGTIEYNHADTSIGKNGFSMPSKSNIKYFYLGCCVKSGATVSNLTFSPMIRLASDPDNTYVPYSMTNQQMTPYVQAISNPNLLDNPWFTVNQRGFTDTLPSNGYCVDRFVARGTMGVSLSNGVITLVNNRSDGASWFGQKIEEQTAYGFIGKPMTLSFMLSNGDVKSWSFVLPDTSSAKQSDDFNINGNVVYLRTEWTSSVLNVLLWLRNMNDTISIKAIKLELGSVSTLAMDTAPNYASELLKCQRYFYAFNSKPNLTGHSYAIIGTGYATSANNIRVPFYLPVEMRIVPTVSVSALSDVVIMSEVADAGTPSAIAIDSASCDRNNIGLFNITSDGNFVKGHSASVYTKNGCRIDLSADL